MTYISAKVFSIPYLKNFLGIQYILDTGPVSQYLNKSATTHTHSDFPRPINHSLIV